MRQRWLRLLAWLRPDPPPRIIDAVYERQQIDIHNRDRKILELQQAQILSLREKALYAASEELREYERLDPVRELIEAQQMAGSGPWIVGPETAKRTGELIRQATESMRNPEIRMREALPLTAQGAWGDVELTLQNIDWRREINFSWLEFSRWGIQQIILISRLNFLKNPLIQRGINVAAHYVFGRGVSVSSPDPDANDVLKAFFVRNKKTLGQTALTDLERRKYYDGNIFFAFFPDKDNTGQVDLRTIDSTEIMDIVTDPEDADTPWFYKRVWIERAFNPESATVGPANTEAQTAWYPALGYTPDVKVPMIGGKPVKWDVPVLHRKCGQVSKWHFGVPLVFSAIDWAKSARRYLEACLTTNLSLAQFAMTLTTKGGMQALAGFKQQMQTTVGNTGSSPWDQNPPTTTGGTFAAGPGTELKAFSTQGAGSDPEKVRQYKLMVAMVFGIPETFFGDVSTGNLATATSLDRPTELNFIEKQESWREDLETIAQYVLSVSLKAPGGRLREAMEKRKLKPADVVIREVARVHRANGRFVEQPMKAQQPDTIEVSVTFPAIREGDLPQLIAAWAQAMYPAGPGTDGIDEKAGIEGMMEVLDVEDRAEILEAMYPEDEYEPDRTQPDPTPPPPTNGFPPQPQPGGAGDCRAD